MCITCPVLLGQWLFLVYVPVLLRKNTFNQTDERTETSIYWAPDGAKNNQCPKRTAHVMHNKMLLGAKQFSDLLSHSTLFEMMKI